MKNILLCLLLPLLSRAQPSASSSKTTQPDYEVIRLESHIPHLHIALIHEPALTHTGHTPVLFIHGASFPSSLAAGFRINGRSWMDELAAANYDCYALDFLGYGYSDRYPEMSNNQLPSRPTGRAQEIVPDIDSAINYIRQRTGSPTVNIIAHSWGGSVATLYASRFPEKIAGLVLFSTITASHHPTPASATSSHPADTIRYSYESLTPDERVDAMEHLTPQGERCRLEPEIFQSWKTQWLQSDPLAKIFRDSAVRFPSGPSQDIDDLEQGKSYYDPSGIKAPTLIIRGEWDRFPSNEDAANMFTHLTNAPYKKYTVIEKGTHVMHLEQSRHQLYTEVQNFLNSLPMSSNTATSANNSPSNSTGHSIAVIFEVIPIEGKKQDYLDIAATLKPELEKIDGFISIERFQSLTHPEKILSLSFHDAHP